MIVATDLRKVFKDPKKRSDVVAVDRVSFTAPEGEIFGLLGVNGAGKTTVLRMLSTIIKPSDGRASVNGADIVNDDTRVRESIGFISTSTALYQRLSGREVLQYFGRLNGLTPAKLKERMEFVIETLRLHEYVDRSCDKLSTGQKQRVNIARAILHDPPVLFLDEPTAGLDVVTSQTIMEFIEETRTTGKTVLFSTHIMTEAERLCDKIAVIHQGRIHAEGSLSEVLAQGQADNLERAFLNLVGYQEGQVVE